MAAPSKLLSDPFPGISFFDDIKRGDEDIDYGDRTAFFVSTRDVEPSMNSFAFPAYFKWLAAVTNPQLAADGKPDIGRTTHTVINFVNDTRAIRRAKIYIEERTRSLEDDLFIDIDPQKTVWDFSPRASLKLAVIHNCPLKLRIIQSIAESSVAYTVDIKPNHLLRDSQFITITL